MDDLMLILVFISTLFFCFGLAALFIYVKYHSRGKVFSGKILAIYRHQNPPNPANDNYTGTYYSPVIEYYFNQKERVIFIGEGDAEIKFSIGKPIKVLVVDGVKENVVIRNNTYLLFGALFILMSFISMFIYVKQTTFISSLIAIALSYIIIPVSSFFSIKKKFQNGFETTLLKNTNIVSIEQLESMDILWKENEIVELRQNHSERALIGCYILMVLCVNAIFFIWMRLDPVIIETIDNFLHGNISWVKLGAEAKKPIVIIGCLLYAAGVLTLSILRLKKNRTKSSKTISINS